MQARPVKLIKSNTSEQQFYMLHDEQIGKGGSGQVFRAVDLNNPARSMVVKVIPIKESYSKVAVERELDVISQLPEHPNLVRTWPIRCLSQRNYYIFMEYCQDGTLARDMKAKLRNGYEEQEILERMYQLIEGYQVLHQQGIVHLDIKPDNILVQDGLFKYADFGLAAIQAGNQGVRRQGTKSYMAPQRFTTQVYMPDPLSDVYSIGIMLFIMIAGHHPYVSVNSLDRPLKEFVLELLTVPCSFPTSSMRFSLEFRHVVEVVMGMVQRNPAKRTRFQKVLEFVQTNRLFEQFKHREMKVREQIGQNPPEHDFVIKDYTQIEVTPLKVPEVQEPKQEEPERPLEADLQPINEYIISHRVMICFFDRLIRRLTLQSQQGYETQYMLIFGLLQLIERIQVEMIHQFKHCEQFDKAKWEAFRKGNQKQLIDIIQRDYSYVQYEIEDFLKERTDVDPQIVANSRSVFRSNFQSCFTFIGDRLKKYFQQNSTFLDENSRVSLTTVLYLIRAYEIVDSPDKWLKDYQKLEQFDYEAEILKKEELVLRIIELAPFMGAEIIGVDITGDEQKMQKEASTNGVTEIMDDYD